MAGTYSNEFCWAIFLWRLQWWQWHHTKCKSLKRVVQRTGWKVKFCGEVKIALCKHSFQMFMESSPTSHFLTLSHEMPSYVLITIRKSCRPYGGLAFPKAHFNPVNDWEEHSMGTLGLWIVSQQRTIISGRLCNVSLWVLTPWLILMTPTAKWKDALHQFSNIPLQNFGYRSCEHIIHKS